VALLGLLLSGCATHYTLQGDGIYYERPSYRSVHALHVDPLVYPYWSLDYFYYSRYYHPYSVVVHRFDPWYYPYPGWYYGYWAGPRFTLHASRRHYPWYRHGKRYAGYQPWRFGGYLGFGYDSRNRYDNRSRVRELDARLRELEMRRSLAARNQRPDRQLRPRAAPWLPATSGGAARRQDANRAPAPGSPAANRRGTSRRQALLERLGAAEHSTRSLYQSNDHTSRPPRSTPRPNHDNSDRRQRR